MRQGILLLLLFPLFVRAQEVVAVMTSMEQRGTLGPELERLREAGLEVAVVMAPGVYLARHDAHRAMLRPEGVQVFTAGTLPAQRSGLDPARRTAFAYLEALNEGRFESPTVSAPMDWGGHDCGTHATTADRGGGEEAPPDWACGTGYNSEQLLGTVTASTFFVESNGTVDPDQYSWTPAAIEQVKLQVIDAWSIWSYTAALHGHTLVAVMDWHEPTSGLTVQGYEPILHPSSQDHLWLDAIMQNAGRTESGTTAMLKGFAHDRRMLFGTDRSFNCFFAYNPPTAGAPSQFTDGKIGYAFLGGPYAQLLYKANGWSVEQITRVYGHEMAHLFHAFDEYTGSGSNNCSRSFNGRQNLNFQGGSCNGGQSCVMIDNSFTGSGATRRWNLCDHTPIHLGWSGTLLPATAMAPVDDVLLPQGAVTFQWSPGVLPPGSARYVRIIDRSTGNTVHCASVTGSNSVTVNLLDGSYEWTLSKGVPDVFNGYAGVTTAPALFRVDAPLHAEFSTSVTSICPGGTVVYADLSTGGPTAWNWTFPGGSPSTFEGPHPPAISYAQGGAYGASLVLTDGVDTVSFELETAVQVQEGIEAPYLEDFEEGIFPSGGWSTPVQSGSIPWAIEGIAGCGVSSISAHVNAYPLSGAWRMVRLVGPLLDLTGMERPYVRFRYSYARESSMTTEVLLVSARDCGGFGVEELLELGGEELATNGGAFVSGYPWYPTNCSHWREAILPLEAFAGSHLRLQFDVATRGGQNVWLDDVQVFDASAARIRVFLEGPFSAADQLMNDSLRQQGLVPHFEPYTELGCTMLGGGYEKVPPAVLAATGPDAIVDWVLVELRNVQDPAVVRSSRAALLQRDGDVVEVDGVSLIRFPLPPGDYHLCVRHRNHLGVMTAAPVGIGPTPALLDLGSPATPTWGTDARKVMGGKALLWCGEVSGDRTLRYTGPGNDRDPILLRVGGIVPTATVTGYLLEDLNMDGRVKYTGTLNDRDRILQNVGIVPTEERYEQVP